MFDILKFVACLFFIALILIFAIPLVWIVIKMIALFFGGLLAFAGVSIWLVLFIVAVAVIIFCCCA